MTVWKQPSHDTCPHRLSIHFVDGTHVRNHYDSDFSQGGNGFRYRWIPKNEIWIDAQISEAEWPFIAFHECTEVELMRSGMSYDRAHDKAKAQEDQLRHEGLQPLNRKTKGNPMPSNRRSSGITFHTQEKDFKDLDKAILEAGRVSLALGGKYTTILIYAHNRRAALDYGGPEAEAQFDSHPDEPLAGIQVKVGPVNPWR